MQSKRYSYVHPLLTILAILFSFFTNAQLTNTGPVIVTSDKADYAPRSNAVFTGSGFLPGEDVVLKVKNLNRPCNTVTADSSYLPWTVKADESGFFTSDWLVCDCLGDSLRLKAVGQKSGYIAYAYFTDANTKLSLSNVSVPYGSIVTLSATLTQQGNDNSCSSCVGQNNPIPGKSISFTIEGSSVGSSNTNSSGVATIPTSLNGLPVATYNNSIVATFAGDPSNNPYAGSNIKANLTVTKASTIISEISGSGTYGGTATLTAKVNLSVVGIPIVFSIDGNQVGTANTNSSGIATLLNVNLSGKNAGTYATAISASIANTTNYSAANGLGALTIYKANATISFVTNDLSQTYNGSAKSVGYSINPSGITGVSILYSQNGIAISNPINAGTYLVEASLSNSNYQATTATSSLVISKANQTITVTQGAPTSAIYSTSFTVFATSSSGLPVSYSGTTPLINSGGSFTMTSGIGKGIVRYNQAGDDNYNAATEVVEEVNAQKASQTIDFETLESKTYGDGSFALSASASNGLPVGFSVSGPASYNETTGSLTINGAGTVTVTASQAGNENYMAAANVVRSFEVAKGAATIVVNGYNARYDGAVHGASLVSITGAKGESLAANLVNLGSTYTNVPGGQAHWTFAGDENHLPTEGNAAIVITKALNAIAFGALTAKTYGNADFSLDASSSSGLPVTYTASGNVTVNGDLVHITGAGSATITAHQAGNDNYEAAENVSQELTINKANAIINVAGYNGVYDGNAHGATGSATGVFGEDLNSLLSLGNSYTNYPGGAAGWSFAGNDKYNESSGQVNIVVNKANATITVTPYEVTFDGNEHNASGSVKGVNGESLSGLNLDNTKHTNAGSYTTDTWSFTDETGNYNDVAATSITNKINKAPSLTTITIIGAPFIYTGLAITPASVSVTGAGGLSLTPTASYENNTNAGTATVSYTYEGDDNHLGSGDSKTFVIGKADPVIEVQGYNSIYDGNAHGATGTAIGVQGESLSGLNLGASFTNAPGGTAKWSFTDATGNYNNKNGSVDIAIVKANATITVTPYDVMYDGNEHTSIGSAIGVKGENLSGLNLIFTKHTNAGNYDADTWSFTDNTGNYNDVAATSIFNKIDKAPSVTAITITGAPFIYMGSAITPAMVSVTGAGGLNLAPTATYVNNTNAGTATASYIFAGDANHESSQASETFTIDPKAIAVTPDAYSKTYGEVDPVFTYQAPGLVGSDNLSGTLTRAAGENVGVYPINGVLTNSNYSVTLLPASLTITKAPLTITAADKNREYGEANPAFTGSFSGQKNGESFTVGGASEALTTSPVGDYVIVPSVSGATLDNYTVTPVNGKLTVGPRSISITANSKIKTYNDNDPELTFQITAGSLVGTDMFSGVLNRDAGEDVGDYTIRQGTVALSNNYTITFNAANLTITQATAIINVTGYTGAYDGNSHGAAGTAIGVKGEDLSALLNLGSTFTNVPGGTANWSFAGNTNYKALSGNTSIVINKAKPVITLTYGGVVNYDGKSHYVTSATVTGVGSPAENLGNAIVVYKDGSTIVAHPTNAGTYYVTASFAGNDNYEAADEKYGTLIINKVPLTITVKNASKYVGQVNPSFYVDYYGYVNNETQTALGGDISYTTIATETSCAGDYDVTASGYNSINYDIIYKKGVLTINGVTIDASASGNPIPSGSSAILTAMVMPAAAGVNVTFKVDGLIKGTAKTDASGKATISVTGLNVNVYQVEAYAGTSCATSIAYLPVYDPNNGFVTGGGWINSPAGAYVKEPNAVGKANFGFVAKYKKGSSALLEGETEFQFQAGSLNFKSTSYETATLVISGAKASYRGIGTINGAGSYKFTLVAIDGQVNGGGGNDRVRMKITDLAGVTVYDNQINTDDNAGLTQASTLLGGGSVVIHEMKSNKTTALVARTDEMEIVSTVEFGLKAFPNPTTSQFNIKLESNNTANPITLRISDLTGRVVRIIPGLTAGQTLQLGSEYKPGVYLVEMIQGNSRKQLKLLKQTN